MIAEKEINLLKTIARRIEKSDYRTCWTADFSEGAIEVLFDAGLIAWAESEYVELTRLGEKVLEDLGQFTEESVSEVPVVDLPAREAVVVNGQHDWVAYPKTMAAEWRPLDKQSYKSKHGARIAARKVAKQVGWKQGDRIGIREYRYRGEES